MKSDQVTAIVKKLITIPTRQQKGLVVLVALIFAIQIFHFTYEPEPFENDPAQQAQLRKDVDAFLSSLEERTKNKSKQNKQKQIATISAKYDSLKLFRFDPNTASEQEFQRLGLSTRQTHIIQNYREKGGTFRTKGDFEKMYGLPSVQYGFLAPYIQLPEKEKAQVAQLQEKKATKPKETFDFDPNTISKEDLQRLGFSEKQSDVIVNFRKKGEGFKTKEDFKNVFVVSDENYKRLAPHIKIVEKIEVVKAVAPPELIDLNTATSEELQELKGVGKYYAKLIIEHREKLGGYRTTKQLLEIMKMKEATINSILPKVKANPADITPMFINSASAKRLREHPYIGYEKAVLIMERRERYGFFKSLDELVERKIFTQRQFDKVKPYLRLK